MTFFAILNQYSYLIFSIVTVIAVALGVFVLRQRTRLQWLVASSAVALALMALTTGFFVLRPNVNSPKGVVELEMALNSGRPTLVQFYSEYCIGCMSIEGQLDAVSETIQSTHNLLRIDIHSEAGRELRNRIGFSYTPELILYNIQGEEVWRGHRLPPRSVLEQTRGLGDENT